MSAPEPDTRSLPGNVLTRLHFLWSLLWISLATAFSATGYLLNQLIRPTTGVFSWWARTWSRLMFGPMGIRIRVTDHHGEWDDEPCVLLANHQNGLDIPVVATALPIAFGFVAKAELEHVPFLGAALKHSPSVFVDRSDPRRSLASIRRAAEEIRSGSSVLIFPEGQRSYSGHLAPFMKGAFTLAVESGVPLVPVTIVNGALVFDESRRVSRPGTIDVVVGRPIPLSTFSRKDIPELMVRARQAIQEPLPEVWRNPTEPTPVPKEQ